MKKTKKHNKSDFFVPAGLFLGLGVGFITGYLLGGIFVGLGLGFLAMAIFKKK